MIDLQDLGRTELLEAVNGMRRKGEILALSGMPVTGAGGMGIIMPDPDAGVFINGRTVARVGTNVQFPSVAHGCPACPHFCMGPIISGSTEVLCGGVPVAIVGSQVVFSGSCGPGTAMISQGVLMPQSAINVHTAAADAMAQAGARASAGGKDPSVGGPGGKHLIGHELTHVVQQHK